MLATPTVVFLCLAFIGPIAVFLYQSVDNRVVGQFLPRTVAVMSQWDGTSLLPDAAYGALADDLHALQKDRRTGQLTRRLVLIDPDFRDIVMNAARTTVDPTASPARVSILEADPRWSELRYWRLLRQHSGALSASYLLKSLGLSIDENGSIAIDPASIYPRLFLRTFMLSGCVTLACLALAYPVAYTFYLLSPQIVARLMIFVLIPFWTSLLVRTSSWVMLLQDEGLLNHVLQRLGVIDAPLHLIFNRFGVYVTLTHVLLPYMILPLYTAMRSIPRSQTQAGLSLGGSPVRTFVKVFLPQTMPGAIAGSLLVFVLAIGYYVTPLLVGGPNDQMVGYFIAFFVTQTINWGQASALALVLIIVTVALLACFGKRLGFAFGGGR